MCLLNILLPFVIFVSLQMGFYTTMLRGKGSNVLTFGKEKLKDS
jgi:hypothetical protein